MRASGRAASVPHGSLGGSNRRRAPDRRNRGATRALIRARMPSIVPRHTIVRGAGRVIEDLDGIVEPRLSWRARWLLPLSGGLLLCAVLASSFLRFTPVRPNVLDAVRPATGIKAIELPRTLATLETRLQFSGVTGLTTMDMSDGFRD